MIPFGIPRLTSCASALDWGDANCSRIVLRPPGETSGRARAEALASGSRERLAVSASNEESAYVAHEGEQLYVVHHRAVGERRGAVLFIGPLGLERTHAYASAARWGRTLAAAGFDTMRFDF